MRKAIYGIVLLMSVLSCTRNRDTFLLTSLPASYTGVDFQNSLTETEEFNIIEYLYFNNGAGVAAGDINNDGLLDLYFSANQHGNSLYLNTGDLKFKDITMPAGVEGSGDWSTGVSMADVNGDGHLDIYVCNVSGYKGLDGHNLLFINQGDLTFKEESAAYGLDFKGFSTQAAFFDYDLDGDLDMYLLNHSVHSSRTYGMSDLRKEEDQRAGDRLYRNDTREGRRYFTEVTKEAGIYRSQIGYGLGVNTSDMDNDGHPDIYISNDFHENDYLYLNQGDGTFKEELTEMIQHTSRSSMGNDVADFNNDGLVDIMVLDMLPDEQGILKRSGTEDELELFRLKLQYGYAPQYVHNTLQLNLGNGKFSEIARLAGVHSTDWSWSALFCDLDNDGWKDLFVTSGIYRRPNDLDYVTYLTGGNRYDPSRNLDSVSNRELYEQMPLQPDINHLFRNRGNLTFEPVSARWGFLTPDYSNGSTYADLDNDGDLELIVNNINAPASIFENNAETLLGQHHLSVNLKGGAMNKDGIGARVSIYCGGKKQTLQQVPTRGFMSSTLGPLHFGLGGDTLIDSLHILWPGLQEQKLYHLEADQIILLDRAQAGPLVPEAGTPSGKTIFSRASIPGLEFRHRENDWEDIDREALIPANLSAEGPALAAGDVNGDGLVDVFVGGATDQVSRLFIQRSDGSFESSEQAHLLSDRYTEDVDAAFFDAEGDGDLDLYLIRGGSEEFTGSPIMADRLVLNDGQGNFTHSPPGSFPLFMQNSSCVRPADFDGDGDTDLFLGTRSIPGAYGISPEQYIMENDGSGRFMPLTPDRLGELNKAGMVTDATWTDYDRDGDPDLVVVGTWMKVSVFENQAGTFTEVTDEAGLGETSGWWYCIEAADLDGDGDMDLVAGNHGLNSMLKASREEPVELWLNDFDNNGIPDPIISTYHEGQAYPIASLDELKRQIIGIDRKYTSYESIGGQTVEDIFGEELLSRSLHKTANTFESAVFINQGDGTFQTQVLSMEAQFSPVRDLLSGDFNEDGIPDLLLAGNNYSTRPSLGRQDASYGWLMLGNKDLKYEAMWPGESGFSLQGDLRKLMHLEVKDELILLCLPNNGYFQFLKHGN